MSSHPHLDSEPIGTLVDEMLKSRDLSGAFKNALQTALLRDSVDAAKDASLLAYVTDRIVHEWRVREQVGEKP